MHDVHVVLHDHHGGHNIILRRPVMSGFPAIPAKLKFHAVWIYNLTTGEIIKSAAGHIFTCIGAVEVGDDWLIERGYVVHF